MSKYAVFFTLKSEAIARAMEQPSDRVAVVSKAVVSAGGKLEAYYLMFGQYDGFVIVDLPDSRAAAASSLAVSSTGAFEHLEQAATWRGQTAAQQPRSRVAPRRQLCTAMVVPGSHRPAVRHGSAPLAESRAWAWQADPSNRDAPCGQRVLR